MRSIFTCVFLIFVSISLLAQEESRLMRFPAIHGNQIVFTYAGDLYTANSSGGTARKLTGDVGYEMFSRFSPDGKHIASTKLNDLKIIEVTNSDLEKMRQMRKYLEII